MKTIKEQFVTYEIALALKELGFDEPCIGFYYLFNEEIRSLISTISNTNSSWENGYISMPLWQQCIDWFREEYKINILIVPVFSCYQMKISKYNEIEDDNIEVDIDCLDFKDFTSYNECRYEAILKAIELCKNQ